MSALNQSPPSLMPFSDALERVRPELEAIPEGEVLGINLDLPQAVTIALGAFPKIAAHRAAIASELPKVDLAKLDSIETYARAAANAHAAFMAASTLPPMKELAARAAHLRQLLCSDAVALGNRGLLDSRRLDGLKGPQGHVNLAFDLLVVARLFRELWPQLRGKTAVDEHELDAAELLAAQLIAGKGARQRTAPKVAATADERRRAYTLLANAYDEARRAISFLRWKHGDAESIAPSLFGTRARRRRERGPEPESVESAQPPR